MVALAPRIERRIRLVDSLFSKMRKAGIEIHTVHLEEGEAGGPSRLVLFGDLPLNPTPPHSREKWLALLQAIDEHKFSFHKVVENDAKLRKALENREINMHSMTPTHLSVPIPWIDLGEARFFLKTVFEAHGFKHEDEVARAASELYSQEQNRLRRRKNTG
jgi:hypothetical protein